MAANLIVRKGDLPRWHGEARAHDTSIKPGYMIEVLATGKVKAHATAGGRSDKWFAKEDYLRGGSVDGKLYAAGQEIAATYYDTDDLVLFHKARPGDVIQVVVPAGAAAITAQDTATSNGNGMMKKSSGSDEIVGRFLETLDNSAGADPEFIMMEVL